MNRFFTIIVSLFLLVAASPAQNQTVAIGNLSSCAGQEVLIPVRASNLNAVGAITMFIEFDTLQLRYIALDNIDNQLTSLNYNFLDTPPSVAVAWSDLVGGNFPDTKLFDIRMMVTSAPGNLYFSSSCEISGSNLQVLPVSFVDGTVSSTNPLVTIQPQSFSIQEGMDALFDVTAENTDSYHWKESRDEGYSWSYLSDGGIYSGTHARQLTLHQVPQSFTGYRYSCFLSKGMCFTNSSEAVLSVDSIMSTETLPEGTVLTFQASPNPYSETTRLTYNLPSNGLVHLEFFNIFGQKIWDVPETLYKKGVHSIVFNFPGLQDGLYLCKLGFTHDEIRNALIVKLIKE